MLYCHQVTEQLNSHVRDPHTCDLLDNILVLDPSKHYVSDSALMHDFSCTHPMPCDLSNMMAQHKKAFLIILRHLTGLDTCNHSIMKSLTVPFPTEFAVFLHMLKYIQFQ
jgi:hypothetical protein